MPPNFYDFFKDFIFNTAKRKAGFDEYFSIISFSSSCLEMSISVFYILNIYLLRNKPVSLMIF